MVEDNHHLFLSCPWKFPHVLKREKMSLLWTKGGKTLQSSWIKENEAWNNLDTIRCKMSVWCMFFLFFFSFLHELVLFQEDSFISPWGWLNSRCIKNKQSNPLPTVSCLLLLFLLLCLNNLLIMSLSHQTHQQLPALNPNAFLCVIPQKHEVYRLKSVSLRKVVQMTNLLWFPLLFSCLSYVSWMFSKDVGFSFSAEEDERRQMTERSSRLNSGALKKDCQWLWLDYQVNRWILCPCKSYDSKKDRKQASPEAFLPFSLLFSLHTLSP